MVWVDSSSFSSSSWRSVTVWLLGGGIGTVLESEAGPVGGAAGSQAVSVLFPMAQAVGSVQFPMKVTVSGKPKMLVAATEAGAAAGAVAEVVVPVKIRSKLTSLLVKSAW